MQDVFTDALRAVHPDVATAVLIEDNSPVDAYGVLKAQIADLEKRAKTLRDSIVALGVGAHEGRLYRATVSVSERETLDMDAVRAHLSRQFIAAHTTVTEVTTVRAVARNGRR